DLSCIQEPCRRRPWCRVTPSRPYAGTPGRLSHSRIGPMGSLRSQQQTKRVCQGSTGSTGLSRAGHSGALRFCCWKPGKRIEGGRTMQWQHCVNIYLFLRAEFLECVAVVLSLASTACVVSIWLLWV